MPTREMHDRKRDKADNWKWHMVDNILSSVIGKIWMNQSAFCGDAPGTVICECLLLGGGGFKSIQPRIIKEEEENY